MFSTVFSRDLDQHKNYNLNKDYICSFRSCSQYLTSGTSRLYHGKVFFLDELRKPGLSQRRFRQDQLFPGRPSHKRHDLLDHQLNHVIHAVLQGESWIHTAVFRYQ